MYGWLCGLSAVLVLPEAVSACVYGTDFLIGAPRANGLVELTWRCRDRYCSEQDVPNPLRIVDAGTMEEVSGAVVWTHGEGTMVVHVFWRPTQPLAAGRTYRILDLQAYAAGKNEFTASPEVTWVKTEDLDLHTDLDYVEDRAAGEISCPARYERSRCFPATEPSPKDATVYTRLQGHLWISAYATHPSESVPPLKRRAVYWRDGEAPVDVSSRAWSLDQGSKRITEGATRYCFRTAVQNLLDGSERVWEGCMEHGDLPELTTREASREEVARDTEGCAEPPAGFEKEWCEQSTLACERDYAKPAQSDCENVARRCAGLQERDDRADDDDAGSPDGDVGEPRDLRASGARSGCNVAVGPHGSSSPLLVLATAFAAAALLRRKRR
jgi:MYXO-CTERM domain-containing protein